MAAWISTWGLLRLPEVIAIGFAGSLASDVLVFALARAYAERIRATALYRRTAPLGCAAWATIMGLVGFGSSRTASSVVGEVESSDVEKPRRDRHASRRAE